MRTARKSLAILAFAAIVGCTVQPPAGAPSSIQDKLPLPATEAAYRLTRSLTRRFARLYDEPGFQVDRRSYQTLMRQLERDEIDYFVSSHAAARDDLWAAPLAVQGIAFIVNPAQPWSDLPIDQLRDIFVGRLAGWSALAEPALELKPFTVSASRDLYLEVQRLLTGASGLSSEARLVPDFQAMLNSVAEAPGAIGYLPLGFLDERVKALSIDGAPPTAEALRRQLYPLRSTIYVIGKREPPPAYQNLIGWIQSEAGQAIVSETHAPLP